MATARERYERAGLFDVALTNMPHGLCMFDASKRLILCNPAYARLYRLPPDLTERGTPLDTILRFRTAAGSAPTVMDSYFEVIQDALDKGDFAARRVRLEDGRTIQITHNPMADGGYVATHEDVTATVLAEDKVRYLASHDALTGLSNRAALSDKLADTLARLGSDEMFAVHCVDLDQFKAVNDTYGHATGDLLLRSVTERLCACVGDRDTIARLGGDEFVVLQMGIDDPDQARSLARRLIGAMSRPILLGGNQMTVGTSVGISLCPRDGSSAEGLLRSADIALYRAKLDGRNTFRFFAIDMDRRLQSRRQLEQDLRAAVVAGGFQLHYQPLVDATTAAIRGFEALLRWTHPVRGPVPPMDFIPLAEETGLIVQIGEWALEQACRDAMAWPETISVAVNLSPVQFKDGRLVETVRSALAAAGLSPARLELEITESVLLVESQANLLALHELRRLGVRIALDDFGTGYSSLSYLRSFTFDKIKIDRSFIRDMANNEECAAIVRAVAGLGTALRMTTTAEGVETAGQLRHVREHGCGEIQGYLYGAAMSAADVDVLLRSGFDTVTLAAGERSSVPQRSRKAVGTEEGGPARSLGALPAGSAAAFDSEAAGLGRPAGIASAVQ